MMLGLAAAAPAQFTIHGTIGRHLHVAANFGCRPICAPRPMGHWETRCEQVFVPGYWTEDYVPARYGWIETRCGHRCWGEIEPAHTCRRWVEGYYRTEERRVWVPGC